MYKKMFCQRCSSMFIRIWLRKIKHPKGYILDVCDKCGGMWLDGDELDILGGKKWQKKKSRQKRQK